MEEVVCDEREDCADEEDADKSFHDKKKDPGAACPRPGLGSALVVKPR